MNGQDIKDLNVLLEKVDQADKDREQMHTDIKFIKENLFNPHEGLWAESKLNLDKILPSGDFQLV